MCSLQNGPKKSRARSRNGSGGACARCKMRRHLRSSLSGCLNFSAPFCGSVNAIADRAMFFRLPAVGNTAAPTKSCCPRKRARDACQDPRPSSDTQRKSPGIHEILGALFVWWSRGDLNPKLQYPGQIKASAHYAGNLDLLDCSQ